ncbi:MAG: phosphate transporter substrate-binding protein PhoT family [Rickettsiaceae bacterium]|jgi:phosphate transport system substrate-binding protein|nr:phosphate transporter substrate-binding protein PhoT family [Rickettsiaceae bacterium]
MLLKRLILKLLLGLSLCGLQSALAASSLKNNNTSTNTITISGSATIKSILNFYEPTIEKDSGIVINIIGNNSKQGVLDLINGAADLAIISTPLTYLSKELPDIDVTSLRSYPLGKTSIAFITHPNNPVKKLSMEQIKDIILGNVTNWHDLGGNDEEILVVTEFPGGGIRNKVENDLLKRPITSAIKAMENASQIKDIVAAVPNAIGITSSSLTDATVHIIESDRVISQPIIFVAKPIADERITKFIRSLKVVNLNEVY